jgi:peptidylprolyl isomerase/peptidyl-prolyl cis-trans isomerase B (cyclophilin B)
VGSIFVVCLKPHPEWNDEHVPVGEVVAGLDQLEKPGTRIFREVTLLSEAEYKEAGGTPAATQTPAQSQLLGNPEAVIKTSKGALTVELFEDAARNTVANFVTLVGDKFYDKLTKGEGKQKIFVVNDGSGKPLLAQTGSPTNELDPSSGPGYSIPSEVNTRKHSRGALAMVVAYDETNKLYIPDTSGSQFFICLQDVSYYDYLKSFTVFGQVTSGMEILDKLTEGDTIESIEITKKKTHPYNFRKVSNP